MNSTAPSKPTKKKDKIFIPEEKFVGNLFYVLRKIKIEKMYHFDYRGAAKFKDDRFPDDRFPIFPYHFDDQLDAEGNHQHERLYDENIWLPYDTERSLLVKWAEFGCIVKFGVLGQSVDYSSFISVSALQMSSVWIRINEAYFKSVYAEVAEKPFDDVTSPEEPAPAEFTTEKEKIIPFKTTPEYSVVTVKGQHYPLSPLRAEAFKIMHEYHQKGLMPIHQKEILNKLSRPHQSDTLKEVFKKSGLWNTVIVPVGQGLIQLCLPENSDSDNGNGRS